MNSNRGPDPDDLEIDENEEDDDPFHDQFSSSSESGYLKQEPKKKKQSTSASKKSLPHMKGMDVIPAGKTVFFDLDYKTAAALCYIPVAPGVAGILWLLTENTQNRYLRFHCIQSIALIGAFIAVNVVFGTVRSILSIIPMLGDALGIVLSLFGGLIALAVMGISFRLMYSVWQGKEVRLPVIANIVDRYAEPSS
jgi:uncharacterized membrane protein